LSSYPIRRDTSTPTFRAGSRQIILSFTDVAESNEFSIGLLMVGDGDRAFFTLRDKPTVVADNPWGKSFFIHNDSDSFSLLKIFLESSHG
jgi:hypothetical protein